MRGIRDTALVAVHQAEQFEAGSAAAKAFGKGSELLRGQFSGGVHTRAEHEALIAEKRPKRDEEVADDTALDGEECFHKSDEAGESEDADIDMGFAAFEVQDPVLLHQSGLAGRGGGFVRNTTTIPATAPGKGQVGPVQHPAESIREDDLEPPSKQRRLTAKGRER